MPGDRSATHSSSKFFHLCFIGTLERNFQIDLHFVQLITVKVHPYKPWVRDVVKLLDSFGFVELTLDANRARKKVGKI